MNHHSKITSISLLVVAFLFPLFSHAALLTRTEDFVDSVLYIVGLMIPVAAALALLFFFWGLAKFILKAGDEGAREEGKHVMVWGIVALFVIASIWGITEFLGGEIGIWSSPTEQRIPRLVP